MKEQLLSKLNLEEGYYISNVERSEDLSCIYIDIDYDLKYIPCPKCHCSSKIHDRLKKIWRHTDYENQKVYIRFKTPRSVCEDHGVKLSEVNWAKPEHRFTIELEDLVCTLAQDNSFLQIAKALDEHDTRIRRVVKRRENEENN